MWQKEQVIDELQKRGKRVTEQRKMLLDVILEGKWVSCKDIYYEARKKDPGWGWPPFTGLWGRWRRSASCPGRTSIPFCPGE